MYSRIEYFFTGRFSVKAPFSALTQSRFFHSAFNSAIFDGPVRIYFVQFHETFALKIYFALQDELAPLFNSVKDYSKDSSGSTVLIMVYPTEEVFNGAFPQHSTELVNGQERRFGKEIWEEEDIIGVIADESEDLVSKIVGEVKILFNKWNEKRLAPLVSADFSFKENQFELDSEDHENFV